MIDDKAVLMKAAMYDRYGPPEVVEIRDIPKPVPARNEVLIKVIATTVSSGDWRARSLETPAGFKAITRLAFGIFRPRRQILGTELSGVIEDVGKDVFLFHCGDEVIAQPGLKSGSHAEYRTMPESGNVIRKPENLTFEQAASLCFGGTTALYFLRTKANIRSEESVLVIGASGCVGSAAVQLAKHFGARVTAVCSTANVDLVKSIGADQVIDYTREDFAQAGENYDIVFDTVGAVSMSQNLGLLRSGGRLLLAVAGLPDLLKAPFLNLMGRKRIIVGVADENPEAMAFVAKLAETEEFTPVIDRTYPFSEIRDAHTYVATGRKRGSVVVLV